MSRVRGSCGAAALELVLGAGLLVLPIAMLVATFPTWAERATMARVAVEEAARVAARADDASAGEEAGTTLAVRIAANHAVGRDDLVSLEVTVDRDAVGDPARDGTARARLQVRMPLTALPFVGEVGGFAYTASHTELLAPYRSVP